MFHIVSPHQIYTENDVNGLLYSFTLAVGKSLTHLNDNLLQQASTIYKAWFEDFIPFDGICPAWWKQGTLSDIADITSGKRPPMKSTEKTDIAIIPLVGATSVMGFTNKSNHTDKILVTGRVGTHGVVQRFNTPCWTSDNTLVITSDFYEYTYQILQQIDYHAMNRGSTQPLITQGDMNKVAIIIPDRLTLDNFETLIGQLMQRYEANIMENTKLAELRDALLPRLMSGELDVSDIAL
ncbi:MAG: restriction endonuclease subunit S [Ruminobacter sp.]|nr:restriction endonuclease subunit S [Ruminobacter sp.]